MLPLTERAYRHIRDQMLMGLIKPGQKVSESAFAEEIGVSRTPVREALVRLETMGLIEQQPGIGTRIREPNRSDMEECFELRELLECGAASLAAQLVTDSELAELDQMLAQYLQAAKRFKKPVTQAERDELNNRANILDLSFHLKLMAVTKNRRMVQVVADVNLLTRILRHRPGLPAEQPLRRMSRVLLHHHRIVRALRKRDSELACETVKDHVRWSRREHLAAFDWHMRNGAAAATTGDGMYFPEAVLDQLGLMERTAPNDQTLAGVSKS